MTKKIFAQPEMKVVKMTKNDIITDSLGLYDEEIGTSGAILAPGRRFDGEDFYLGY